MSKLSNYQKGYLEGILDAEGTLSVRKSKSKAYSLRYQFIPVMNVTNTDIHLLRNLQKLVGDGHIYIHSKPKNPKYRICYSYRFSRNSMRTILPQIRLIAKKKQKIIVLKALKILNNHRGLGNPLRKNEILSLEKYVDMVRQLNKKGLNVHYKPIWGVDDIKGGKQ